MKKFFFYLILSFLSNSSFLESMTYDCFLFFNEVDLLEIRLNELDEFVDRFVIVECVESFQGNEKPLYFLENRDRFNRFSKKIIHIIVEEKLLNVIPWERESYQRNQIMRGLTDCKDSDTIIVGDIDEIIRGSLISKTISDLKESPSSLFGFSQRMHHFFFNTYYTATQWESSPPIWVGSVATSYKIVSELTPQILRDRRSTDQVIPNGGWHFSSIGGAKAVEYKTNNFSHDRNHLWSGSVKSFSDLTNHPDQFIILPFSHDSDYPQFILDNLQYFENIGYFIRAKVALEPVSAMPTVTKEFLLPEIVEKWSYLYQAL